MAALCSRISVGLLEGAEELFSAAQSPVVASLMLPLFQSRCAAARSLACGIADSRQRRGFSRNEEPFPAKHWHGLRLPAGHGGPWQQAGALGI